MTRPEQSPSDAQLDALELGLRGLAARHDPPPVTVFAQGAAALAMRDLDAELAALVADSFDDQLTGTRAGGATRLLTFAAPGVVLELQVSGTGAGRRLVGALEADGDYQLRLEHRGGSVDLTRDDYGRFHLDGLPSGPLRVHLHAAGGRSVRTSWVIV
ncbi:MAG: hypothetical protein ACXV3C_00545 [Actinomycetes bacterium]